MRTRRSSSAAAAVDAGRTLRHRDATTARLHVYVRVAFSVYGRVRSVQTVSPVCIATHVAAVSCASTPSDVGRRSTAESHVARPTAASARKIYRLISAQRLRRRHCNCQFSGVGTGYHYTSRSQLNVSASSISVIVVAEHRCGPTRTGSRWVLDK